MSAWGVVELLHNGVFRRWCPRSGTEAQMKAHAESLNRQCKTSYRYEARALPSGEPPKKLPLILA